MSKLPFAVVQLSNPLRNRWHNGVTYCTGIVARQEIADDISPMVSSYVQLDLDDDFNTVYVVKCVYTYNSGVALKDTVWHQFDNEYTFKTMREAVRKAESLAREAYETALHNGIAMSVSGRV